MTIIIINMAFLGVGFIINLCVCFISGIIESAGTFSICTVERLIQFRVDTTCVAI